MSWRILSVEGLSSGEATQQRSMIIHISAGISRVRSGLFFRMTRETIWWSYVAFFLYPANGSPPVSTYCPINLSSSLRSVECAPSDIASHMRTHQTPWRTSRPHRHCHRWGIAQVPYKLHIRPSSWYRNRARREFWPYRSRSRLHGHHHWQVRFSEVRISAKDKRHSPLWWDSQNEYQHGLCFLNGDNVVLSQCPSLALIDLWMVLWRGTP